MKHTFFIGYNMYRRIQIDMKRLIFLTAVPQKACHLQLLYPSLFRISSRRGRWSPCMIISPSLAVPPTPHFCFSSLQRAFISSSEPMKPRIMVTVLPPRPARSIAKRSFCCLGGKVYFQTFRYLHPCDGMVQLSSLGDRSFCRQTSRTFEN